MKRVRKAVYKEKDIDDINSIKYRLKIEMIKNETDPKESHMIFSLTLSNSLENI